jgi:hypothetical protein
MRKKLKNMTTKITDEIYESQRTREGFRPLFPLQISVQTPLKIQQIFDLSHKLEEANPEIKGGNESGERGEGDVGSLILFNRDIIHNLPLDTNEPNHLVQGRKGPTRSSS